MDFIDLVSRAKCLRRMLEKIAREIRVCGSKGELSLNFIEFTCVLLLLCVKIITVSSITILVSVKSWFLLVFKILFANTCARILPVTY